MILDWVSSVTAGTATTTSTTAWATSASATASAAISTFASSHWLLLSLFLEPGGVLGVVGLDREGLWPEIWGKVLVSLLKGVESGLKEVLSGTGMTRSGGIAILNTGEGKHLLGDGGADNTGTSGGWDELDTDGSTLSSDLAWNGMHVTDLVTPITTADWDKLELGGNEGALDGNLDFLADLDSKTNVTSHITNGNNSLKAGSLTGLSLLLDGDNLHHIILELVLSALNELVDDLGLLDRDGVGVDLLKRLDHVSLDQSSELGLWDPFVLGGTTTATWSITTSTATSAEASSTLTAITTAFSSGGCSSFHRFDCVCFVFNNN